MKLEECRREIDRIDRQIMNLLNRRALTVRRVGELKARAGIPIVDLEREDEVLRRVTGRGRKTGEPKRSFRLLLHPQKSREIQIETMNEIKRAV